METLNGHWYRGGTSKCWLFGPEDLSGTREEITGALAHAFGSSDPRQLHGVGGGTSTTSKAAVISKLDGSTADISYLFAQVGIGSEIVEYTSNCGNCASAVALFALQQGLVEPQDGVTRVRMLNENTDALISGYVETPGKQIPETGDVLTPGVVEPGVGINVTFENIDGTATGKLLPTGSETDEFTRGGKTAKATCVDAGAPACLVEAATLGAHGAETLEEIRAGFLEDLIEIRKEASVEMGLAPSIEESSPAVPKVGLIGAPRDYTTAAGEKISAQDYELSARMVSMFDAHPAIGITSVVAIARAAAVPGSTVHKVLTDQGLEPHAEGFEFRIGTLSGVITCTISTNPDDSTISVSVLRSARHIADAKIFI